MTSRSARSTNSRSLLDSPWLAAAIVAIVVGVAAALLLPGVLPPGPPGSTATPPTTSLGPSPSPTLALPTFVRPTPSPQPTFMTYVVKRGDTLSSIATEFDTTARSISWWNRGTFPSLDPESEDYDPDNIKLGWELQLIPGAIVDDTNPPTVPPGPNPTTGAGATLPPSTAGPATGPAAVIAHGPRTVNNIALTFDMGGRLDPAVDIVRWLIDHDVHATLFPTGKSATTTVQGLAAMQLAATRPDLFDFANHSWDHPDFREISAAQMADQLVRTEAALGPIVGTTKPWFRPPFGGWNDAVRAGVGAAGWRYAVMWDVDTIDWRPEDNGDGPAGPTTAGIVAKIGANARGGSIVLMHLGGWNTLEALPGILAACGVLGLEPVTLTEMLGS
jgi:peptidoglycan/xylan/chitin deacetylase (PgdA/CDA1 family)